MFRGELRLEQLQAAPDDGIDPGSEQPTGTAGSQNCGIRPAERRVSRPAGPRRKNSVFINANWQFNVNALYQGPWGHQSRRQLLRPPGLPESRTTSGHARRGRGRHQPHVLIQIDQVDTFRYDNVYELDLRLAKTFQIGGVSDHPGGRGLQRRQRRNTSCSATSGPATTGPRRGVHPEPVLQPDPRGAESAHPEARHQRSTSRRRRRHSGARPGIPGGPFRFVGGREPADLAQARRVCAVLARWHSRRCRQEAPPAAAAALRVRASPATSSSSRSTRSRYDAVGFDGNPRGTTPNLDRFAAEGRVFAQAHAHNVITLPSHTNILTGMLPVPARRARERGLPPLVRRSRRWPRGSRRRGYATGRLRRRLRARLALRPRPRLRRLQRALPAPRRAVRVLHPAGPRRGRREGRASSGTGPRRASPGSCGSISTIRTRPYDPPEAVPGAIRRRPLPRRGGLHGRLARAAARRSCARRARRPSSS